MGNKIIDINCDVGEGIGNEADLFPMISSCNIACGGHAGAKESISQSIELALKFNVRVGAHPSYPDRENFGRVSMNISDADLIESIRNQLKLFMTECNEMGATLHHIKPHGALYNDIAKSEHLANVFLSAILPYKDNVILYVPYGSVIESLAKANDFNIMKEAFADRNYNNDLSLVSRKQDQALISNGKEVLEHLVLMYKENQVRTVTGKKIPIQADTFCIHGDTPSAFQILTYITKHLPEHNLQAKP